MGFKGVGKTSENTRFRVVAVPSRSNMADLRIII